MDVALFSPAALFEDDEVSEESQEAAEGKESSELHVQRVHAFPGMELMIREFSFHQLNANLLWPGTFAFSNWLVENQSLLHGARILELGSGTGALAIFLQRSFGVDITTSDFDDVEIEENIAYNCRANELPVLPHVKHTWGDRFPKSEPDWDLVIASDILLYVKQYPNLIKTLCFLLNEYKAKDKKAGKRVLPISGKEVQVQWPFFLMSWRRRLGGEERLFFTGCEDASLTVLDLGSRVYCIIPQSS
ncbi:protein-lysine methyltransferase METTL21C [Canna indica]|uniref:Protein-lysine methyltransferase METTL21C n=1 Tax=Canna indica TaxID=4628 RepID=A0AAQ3K815_9LILI|nr:protein-lysine methyltransferase METTL21C [Canna indica]